MSAALRLLTTLRVGSARPEVGFGLLDAIYLLTTERRWGKLANTVWHQLESAQVGPTVRVVNGTAVDAAHWHQMKSVSPNVRHQMAAAWMHVHVSLHSFSKGHRSAMLLEDDAILATDAAAAAASFFRRIHNEADWQNLSTPVIARLGYAFRRGACTAWDEARHYATL